MTDTLVAAKRIVTHLKENGDMAKAMNILKNEMVGSYCFTFLTDNNTIYAARDPKGFRPLVLGFHKDTQYLYYCIRIVCLVVSWCNFIERY